MLASELAQASFESIPANGGEAEFGNDERDSGMSHLRFEPSDVQEARFHALTRAQQVLDVSGARYPARAGKSELRLRRRRTCWAGVPSDACALFSGDGSEPRDPTSSPSARETRES